MSFSSSAVDRYEYRPKTATNLIAVDCHRTRPRRCPPLTVVSRGARPRTAADADGPEPGRTRFGVRWPGQACGLHSVSGIYWPPWISRPSAATYLHPIHRPPRSSNPPTDPNRPPLGVIARVGAIRPAPHVELNRADRRRVVAKGSGISGIRDRPIHRNRRRVGRTAAAAGTDVTVRSAFTAPFAGPCLTFDRGLVDGTVEG